jgi:hypothetical protein
MKLECIVSGGQTGADRGGLKAAFFLGIAMGGWCPKGRKAEDGEIPEEYPLRETPSTQYVQRTEWNVRDSDATLVFIHGAMGRGSSVTVRHCQNLRKPCCVIDLSKSDDKANARLVSEFIEKHDPRVLNIAGTRGSKAPGIEEQVTRVILLSFAMSEGDRRSNSGESLI